MCPFLLLVTLALLSAPETESTTYLEIVKGLSNGLSSTRSFCHNQGLSQESLLFRLYWEEQKAFPFQPCVFFNVKIQYPSLINTLGSFLPYYSCYWHQPNPLSICLLQFTLWWLPTIPQFKVQGLSPFLSHSGHITSFLTLPYAWAMGGPEFLWHTSLSPVRSLLCMIFSY